MSDTLDALRDLVAVVDEYLDGQGHSTAELDAALDRAKAILDGASDD